jgi:hypothetical protein
MGGEEESIFEQISKFTSVEQYREFLEKEIGEEKLMKAYPKIKEFVSNMTLTNLYRAIISCSQRRPASLRLSLTASFLSKR